MWLKKGTKSAPYYSAMNTLIDSVSVHALRLSVWEKEDCLYKLLQQVLDTGLVYNIKILSLYSKKKSTAAAAAVRNWAANK